MPATSVPRLTSGGVHAESTASPHGLRHSAAGLLIALGALEYDLQERMGDFSSRVTRDVRGHVLPIVDDVVTTEIDRLFADPSRTDRARNRNGVSVSSPFTHTDQGNCSGGERTRTADFYVANRIGACKLTASMQQDSC